MSYSKNSSVPIELLPGVGRRTAAILKSLEIHTVGQFKQTPEKLMVELFGPSIKQVYHIVHPMRVKNVQRKNKSFFHKIQMASQLLTML